MTQQPDRSPPNIHSFAKHAADPSRLLAESANDYATIMLDPAGNVASWNRGAERITGYKLDEIIGRHCSVFYTGEDIASGTPQRLLGVALAEGWCEDIGQRRRNDGSSFWAREIVTALRSADGTLQGFINVVWDVAEQQQAAVALRVSEARYRTLFEYVPVGIVIADTQSYYVDANASICRMLGYTRDELIGMHASDIVVQTEIQHIEAALSEINDQSAHEREWQFRRKDGSVFAAEVIATRMPDGNLLGTIRDITDRKRADDYRAHLAAIVASSSDAIVGEDLHGIVRSWNPGAEAVFGYAAGEMIGTPIARLIPDDRQDEETHILGKLRRGERVEPFETQRQTKDGRLIDVSIAASPIKEASGQIIGAAKIVRDITALKEHEREIDRLSRLYAALSQVNQAIVWMPTRDELFQKICRVLVEHGGFCMAWIGWCDPDTRQLVPVADWGVDQNYRQSLSSYADDQPQARGPSGLAFHSGRPSIMNDLLEDPISFPWRAEFKLRGYRASAAFPIRMQDEVCGTLNIYADKPDFFHDKEIALLEETAADISFALDNFARDEAHQKAELAVRNQQLFSDTMIESMPGIFYFYDAKRQFLRWNQNFETVSGYSGAEIASMHPLDFFSDEHKPLVEHQIAEVFANGASWVEAPFVAKDGHTTPYFFTGRHILFEEMACLVGVGIDISERKQAELALLSLNETLERRVAERTADMQAAIARAEAADLIKSAFLASMSHELRTPLNSIIGFTGILLQGLAGPLNHEQSKQLDMVRSSGHHLLALVNDVLDISKIEAGQLEVAHEPFDLRQSIAKVAAVVTPLAEQKGLSLRFQVAPDVGPAVGDERRFEQILLNLLSNAIKFSQRGDVTLIAELIADFTPEGTASGQPAVRVQVSDTGIGIKPEDLATLFQPFRQIDTGLSRNHEGSGLGLAICRRLAALMGGEIAAESVWSQGSTFSVTLPLKGPLLS